MGHFADLATKTILITGAASGIGRAQVAAFLAEGALVVALDRQPIEVLLIVGASQRRLMFVMKRN